MLTWLAALYRALPRTAIRDASDRLQAFVLAGAGRRLLVIARTNREYVRHTYCTPDTASVARSTVASVWLLRASDCSD